MCVCVVVVVVVVVAVVAVVVTVSLWNKITTSSHDVWDGRTERCRLFLEDTVLASVLIVIVACVSLSLFTAIHDFDVINTLLHGEEQMWDFITGVQSFGVESYRRVYSEGQIAFQ